MNTFTFHSLRINNPILGTTASEPPGRFTVAVEYVRISFRDHVTEMTRIRIPRLRKAKQDDMDSPLMHLQHSQPRLMTSI